MDSEILDTVTACDFVLRAIDDEGAYCRYDALVMYVSPETGLAYLVYADVEPDDQGDVATYVSLCDPEQVEKAQLAVDSGATPKKPPLLTLTPVEDEEELARVIEALDALDALDDEG